MAVIRNAETTAVPAWPSRPTENLATMSDGNELFDRALELPVQVEDAWLALEQRTTAARRLL